MTELSIVNITGETLSKIEVSDNIFNVPLRPYILTEIINWQRAKKRAGIQSMLTKGEVRGTTKKPFAQKGRGVARQGSLKNPHQIGGGVAFACKSRSYAYNIPKSKRRIGLITALSTRFSEKRIIIIDDLKLREYKTKEIVDILNNLKITKALIIDDENIELKKSVANLSSVKYLHYKGINVYDILYFPYLLMTKKGLLAIEKKLLG